METLLADPFFRFSTLYAGSLYVPYAVSLISVDPAAPNHFDFSAPRFENEKALALYVQGLKNASLFSFPVDVTGSDLLLTLATCYGNDADARLIVALRAMRARESRQIVLQELRCKTRAR